MSIKKLALFAAASLFVSFSYAETLEFPKSGFSIESLDRSPGHETSQVLHMFLTPINGFSPNVNVQIQPYEGTLQEYRALSEWQFEQLGFTLISMKEEGDSIVMEYKGLLQGLNLHWYATAHKKGNHIYLVTATGSQADWDVNKEELTASVNSFKLK